MILFYTKILDESGHIHERIEQGESLSYLTQVLKTQGHTILKIEPISSKSSRFITLRKRNVTTLKLDVLSMFFFRLSVLLNAERPLLNALTDLERDEHQTQLSFFIKTLIMRLKEGDDFITVLAAYPSIITQPMLLILRAGMQAGHLARALHTVHAHIEDQLEIRKKLSKALIYPIMLSVMMVIICVGFMQLILPTLITFLNNMGVHNLPLASRILIKCSHFFNHYGVALLSIILGFLIIMMMVWRIPYVQHRLARLYLRIPLVKYYVRTIWTLPWLGTLGLLYDAGLNFKVSLEEAMRAHNHPYTRYVFSNLTLRVLNGTPLDDAMRDTGLFSYFIIALCSVGLNSGNLGQHVLKGYTLEKKQLDDLTQRLVRILEPACVILIGGFMLWLVLAVIVPLYAHLDLLG